MKLMFPLKKRLSLFSLCMVMLIVLTACSSSKKPITDDQFQSIASSNSLSVQDNTSQYAEYDHVVSCTTAYKPSDDNQPLWSMDFLVATSQDMAKRMFRSNSETFESVSGASSTVSVNLSNYGKYERIADGRYMYVGYLEETLIYVDADVQYKDEIKSFIDALGY